MLTPTLETDSLTLRPMTDDDVEVLAATIFADPDIGWRYGLVADTSSPESIKATAKIWIDDANAHWECGGWGAWAICAKDPDLGAPGQFVGLCGFFTANDRIPDHELAYGVASALWGKGIATEATRACLRFIFAELGVDRVETVTHPVINLGSWRVLEKAGFGFLGEIDYLGSVAAGKGLVKHYGVDRQTWLDMNP